MARLFNAPVLRWMFIQCIFETKRKGQKEGRCADLNATPAKWAKNLANSLHKEALRQERP